MLKLQDHAWRRSKASKAAGRRSFRVLLSAVGCVVAHCALASSSAHLANPVATLGSLSDLGALAAAVGLAYANLKSFRYRTRIREHVRKLVEADGLGATVQSSRSSGGAVDRHECWAVLFRLGSLGDTDQQNQYPHPPKSENGAKLGEQLDQDHNFTQRRDFLTYSWMYSSNLDKTISMSLGVLAAFVIWFATVDLLRYPIPTTTTIGRDSFLAGVFSFYAVTILLGCLLVWLHKLVWRWNEMEGWRKKLINGSLVAFALIFCVSAVLATIELMPFTQFFRGLFPGDLIHKNVPGWIAVFEISAAAIPGFLLFQGEQLSRSMVKEADRCGTLLRDVLATGPVRAKLSGSSGGSA